jgi:hypothetical protein
MLIFIVFVVGGFFRSLQLTLPRTDRVVRYD